MFKREGEQALNVIFSKEKVIDWNIGAGQKSKSGGGSRPFDYNKALEIAVAIFFVVKEKLKSDYP